MIVDIPGVGQVEFPDSMDDAAVSAAAKKLHFDAKARTQQDADRKQYSPAGDSFLKNLPAAAGAPTAAWNSWGGAMRRSPRRPSP